MNERIKKFAEEFAMLTETMTGVETEYIFDLEDLERFADLVRADEREACAKLCEPQENHDDPLTAWNIAQLIRGRTE